MYWNILHDGYARVVFLLLQKNKRKIRGSPSQYNKSLTEIIVNEGKIET